MATLTIGDKRVTFDDSFRSLSPPDQQKTVDEIAAQIGIGGPSAVSTSNQSPAGQAQVGAPMSLIQAGLLEVLLGLISLRTYLEADAGQTLAGLGLLTDEGRLQ